MDIDPSFALAHWNLGLIDEQTGNSDEAIAEFQQWQRLSGDDPASTGALGHAFAVAGRRSEAHASIARLKDLSERRYVSPYDIAVVYVGLGEKESAFEWLTKAYDDHSAWLIWINLDRRFDSIRHDSRYRDLVRNMHIPE